MRSIVQATSFQQTSETDSAISAGSRTVAAPDHKIGQCIQRSALFPGRACGWTGGAAEGVWFENGCCSPSPLGVWELCAEKKFFYKNRL